MQLRGLKPNMIVIHVTTQKLYRISRVSIDLDNTVSFVTAVDAGGNAITINRYKSPGMVRSILGTLSGPVFVPRTFGS